MDLKDEPINKHIIYSHYLFSDIVLTSKHYIVAFCDRFLAKFAILENDASRKTVVIYFLILSYKKIIKFKKQLFLDLVEIVGSHEFGYGCFSTTNNKQFILTAGIDGTISVRKTSDPVDFLLIIIINDSILFLENFHRSKRASF